MESKSKSPSQTSNAESQTNDTTPTHRTRPELAVELLSLVSAWFPHKQHMVVGDNAYGGRSVLSHLPADNVHLISGVHPKAALYTQAPPKVEGTKGRPRKKGNRLPTMAAWADDASQPWTELAFHQFGLHSKLAVKTQSALYYKAGGQRLLTIVLTRDLVGGRPDRMFFCTQRDWDARQILSAYASRWAIECTFENCKQHLGLEDPANRLPEAVQRTAQRQLQGREAEEVGAGQQAQVGRAQAQLAAEGRCQRGRDRAQQRGQEVGQREAGEDRRHAAHRRKLCRSPRGRKPGLQGSADGRGATFARRRAG